MIIIKMRNRAKQKNMVK